MNKRKRHLDLLAAANASELNRVEELLREGADPDIPDEERNDSLNGRIF